MARTTPQMMYAIALGEAVEALTKIRAFLDAPETRHVRRARAWPEVDRMNDLADDLRDVVERHALDT